MRTVGPIAILSLVFACSSPETQADNGPATGTALEQPGGATADTVGNDPQSAPRVAEAQGHPCSIQNSAPIAYKFKAIGTEPFWAAEVEGRCVIYKTPEDQEGSRVWTKVRASPQETAWDGALRGKQFQLTVRPKADCSDGMSDKVYPLEAVLRVDEETRRGCAERL